MRHFGSFCLSSPNRVKTKVKTGQLKLQFLKKVYIFNECRTIFCAFVEWHHYLFLCFSSGFKNVDKMNLLAPSAGICPETRIDARCFKTGLCQQAPSASDVFALHVLSAILNWTRCFAMNAVRISCCFGVVGFCGGNVVHLAVHCNLPHSTICSRPEQYVS